MITLFDYLANTTPTNNTATVGATATATPLPTPTPTPRPLTPAEKRAEQQRQIAEEKRQLAETKERVEREYYALVTQLYSYYNYIKVVRRGNALWAEHAYFSQYTFQIGPDGPAVQRWVSEHSSDLRELGIKRVGVRSPEEYGSSCWYNVN